MVVNYATLFEHTPSLVLTYAPDDRMPWRIQNETGQLYARSSTFPQAERFLLASERKGDATIDWLSVETLRALEGTLRLEYALHASGEPIGERRPAADGAAPGPLVSQASVGADEPASPGYSVRVDNVVPIR